MADPRLKTKIEALQLNTAALLKLLGGTDAEKQRFWEKVKGITKPAVLRLVDQQVDVLTDLVAQVHTSVKTIEKSAKSIAAETAAQ
jgi:hypothetical protein